LPERFKYFIAIALCLLGIRWNLRAAEIDSPFFKIIIDTVSYQSDNELLICIWDYLHPNPYRLDLTKKKDTTWIQLVDDSCRFFMPVCGKVNSPFGFRNGRIHSGVDIGLKWGDSVYCAFDGMVRFARYYRGYGYLVIVSHYNGIETMYAHLSKMLVDNGQFVRSGQLIGWGGATGRATGAHLHFETRFMGQAFDPALLIDFENFTLKDETLAICASTFGHVAEVKAMKYHTVRQGDTLYKISRMYGVSIDTLCRLNGINRNTILKIGRKIRYQ